MQDLVSQGKRDFRIRKLVGQLVQNCPPKNYYCYAEQAFLYCRDRIKYMYDPHGVELIESPWKIVEAGVADCDSIVILFSTLCECMGFPCRFVTIKADKSRPNEFSHVFAEVKIPRKGWVGADPTQPEKPFGWQAGPEYPRQTWPASTDAPEEYADSEGDAMSGLAAFSAEEGWATRMNGLGYEIPGVADTPGVLVEAPWEFRQEPALITATPEYLELEPLAGKKPGLISGQQQQEFWLPSQVEEMFDTRQASAAPQMYVLSGLEDFSMPKLPMWVWIAGGAALLLWLSKKK
jgi:hypothetical protein